MINRIILKDIKRNLGLLLKSNDYSNHVIEIITPFLYADKDYISVYVVRKDNQIILTDLGDLYSHLSLFGINLERRPKIIEFIKKQNVIIKEKELNISINVDAPDFHNELSKKVSKLARVISKVSNTLIKDSLKSKIQYPSI